MANNPSIAVVFITYKAKEHLKACLPPFLLVSRVLVVNSSSQDGTVELSREMGAETLVIPRREFNHGSTREFARNYLKSDIVVMMTPDAYAEDHLVLEKLIAPLLQNKASVSYARQVPHKGANFLESFSREFNYPSKSELRSLADIESLGLYTFFCSNACAAYKNNALDEIGGFSSSLFGEDTIAATKLLQAGHKIAYVADAVVHHSHNYTLKQEFQRHFDIGLSRAMNSHLWKGKSDISRANKYLFALLKKVIRKKPHLLPYALLQSFCKLVGYKIGKHSLNAPLWFKKALSSQDFYFNREKLT